MIGFVDIETTGLDPQRHYILEVGIILTDDNLDPVAAHTALVKPVGIYRHTGLDPWVQEQHEKSGLWTEVELYGKSPYVVQREVVKFLAQHSKQDDVPMGGSSIHFDRGFLRQHLPEVEKWFHYRSIDVSTIKELVKRWGIETGTPPRPMKSHRAANDLIDTLEELRFYRREVFKL